eukprot:5787910-Amphidinium_carterae.2
MCDIPPHGTLGKQVRTAVFVRLTRVQELRVARTTLTDKRSRYYDFVKALLLTVKYLSITHVHATPHCVSKLYSTKKDRLGLCCA